MYYTAKEMEAYKKFDGNLSEFNMLFDMSRKVALEEIAIREATNTFGVHRNSLVAQTRKREIVLARQVVGWIMYYYSFVTLERIGSLLGDKDHATISYGVKTIDNLIDTDLSFAIKMQNIENSLDGMNITRRWSRGEKRMFDSTKEIYVDA